jgi:hypothetical protein
MHVFVRVSRIKKLSSQTREVKSITQSLMCSMYGPYNLSYRCIEIGETSIECIWNNGDQSNELI